MPIKQIGRKHGFSDASFYKWCSKYGGMDALEAKRLRELEFEKSQAQVAAGRGAPGYSCFEERIWHKTRHLSASSTSQSRSGQQYGQLPQTV